jgi:hypothetical protein
VRKKAGHDCSSTQRGCISAAQNDCQRYPPQLKAKAPLAARTREISMQLFILFRYLGLLGIAIALKLKALGSPKEEKPVLCSDAINFAAIWAIIAFYMM